MINVLIVDDQRIPREYMEHMISESGRYEPVCSISNAGPACGLQPQAGRPCADGCLHKRRKGRHNGSG